MSKSFMTNSPIKQIKNDTLKYRPSLYQLWPIVMLVGQLLSFCSSVPSFALLGMTVTQLHTICYSLSWSVNRGKPTHVLAVNFNKI